MQVQRAGHHGTDTDEPAHNNRNCPPWLHRYRNACSSRRNAEQHCANAHIILNTSSGIAHALSHGPRKYAT